MKIESTTIGTYRVRNLPPKTTNNPQSSGPSSQVSPSSPFSHVLKQKLKGTEDLKFSAHALRRMTSRAIKLSDQDITKLTQAINKAASKGSRDSLVLLNNQAFVVNVTHRTVITAMDEGSMQENIFTNIDSAVLA